MTKLSNQAEPAVRMLLEANETQLYEQLGMRVKTIELEPEKAGTFDLDVAYTGAAMGPKDDLVELGQKIFKRWNTAAFNLVCSSETDDADDRKKLVDAFNIGETALATVLSGLLVSSFGLAPAIAAVIAAIAIKRFGNPVYEEFCKAWKKHVTT
jgi:hypothetical protein